MATELPYQTYERLTGNTWTGGTTQPIMDAYKQYGITLDAKNPAASSGANLALQAAMLKGLPASSGGTPTPVATPGITVPQSPTGTNPIVSATGDRSNIDALGNTIKDMSDTSGLTSNYNSETSNLNSRMDQLKSEQDAAVADIQRQFDQAQAEQETTQKKDYGGTAANLATAGGGFLGFTGSHAGVLQGLQQTFDQEKSALLQKRDAAINQAKSAYNDKQFAVAQQLATEAKQYQDDLYQKQKDHASNLLSVAQESRQQDEYQRTTIQNKLQDLSTIASSDKPLSLDPAVAKQVDDFYGVPGFTQQYLDTARKAAQTKTAKEQLSTDISIQDLLTKVPAGQTVTLNGKTYAGLKKAATTSSTGTISPLITQQIPQLAPLAGMKEDDIIMSLELSKPPAWFTNQLPKQTAGGGAAPDPQASWDAFRNDPDLVSYRNTVRLNKRQSINSTDPAALAQQLKDALGVSN